MSVLNAGIHEILGRIANQVDHGLILACPVCLDGFGRKVFFKHSENLYLSA